jgi:hypothetical protein
MRTLTFEETVRLYVQLWFEGWYEGKGGMYPSWDQRWMDLFVRGADDLKKVGVMILPVTMRGLIEEYIAREAAEGRRWRYR